MKKLFVSAIAAVMAVVATPALADTVVSPRVEVRAGMSDVVNGIGNDFAYVKNQVTYGAAVGADLIVNDKFVVGAEASIDNAFKDTRDIGVAARAGYLVTPATLVYGKVGYANYQNAFDFKFDGLRVGAGVEVEVLGPVYAGAEYQYTNFEHGYGKHGAFAKVGVKF